MRIVIDIPKQIYLNAKADMLCGGDILVKAIKNGVPLEEELHREKEQAYYLGYEDGRKSEWTAVAESEG